MVFTDLIVSKTPANLFRIDWTQTFDALEGAADYQYKVRVGEAPGPGMPYITELNTDVPPVEVPVIIDGALQDYFEWDDEQFNFDRYYYFTVEAYLKTAPTVIVASRQEHISGRPDGIAMAIIQIERRYNKTYVGAPSTIWKVRVVNGSCPECWNELTRTTMKSNCSTCHGTGYLNDYYSGFSAEIAFEYGNIAEQGDQTSTQINTTTSARMSNYPIVRPGDIILNNDNGQRYVVNNPVQRTQLPRVRRSKTELAQKPAIISQILNLRLLAPKDPEYRIAG